MNESESRVLTGQEWRFRPCGWRCPEVYPPRYPSSRGRSAQSACSAAGCTCARGTGASASPCWCRRRCAWSGKASRAPGGTAGQSCPWSPTSYKNRRMKPENASLLWSERTEAAFTFSRPWTNRPVSYLKEELALQRREHFLSAGVRKRHRVRTICKNTNRRAESWFIFKNHSRQNYFKQLNMITSTWHPDPRGTLN